MKIFIASAIIAVPLPLLAQSASQREPAVDAPAVESRLPEVTIIGVVDDLSKVTGSATVINVEDILRFNQSDIQRIVRSVPGVTVQLEDGYGLRPNLSIRGTASERSARITLLEDGVLVAPAPYAAPAAYYFPTAGRLNAVEVLKGPATITEGPYTIGGAINLISTPIPDESAGFINAQIGQDATWRVHGHYGDSSDRFGWLIETHQWQSDGFQAIDRGGDSGLEKQDYMIKLRYSPDDIGAWRQRFDLKLQYASEDSDQSYLGLTDADFVAEPTRRYGLSNLDNIDTTHSQILLRHTLTRDTFELTTSLYHNAFERDWFKTEGYDVTGSPNAEAFNGVSWFQLIQAVNRGIGIGTEEASGLSAILAGADTPEGAIQIRSNARKYYSTGVEFDARWQFAIGGGSHSLAVGLRLHSDHSERLQRNSTYTQSNGELVLADLGQLGNAGNQEQDADVVALYFRDEIEFGNWLIAPGIRFERIDQRRTRWETRSGLTSDPSARTAENLRDERENNISVLIPGIGVAYQFNENWSAYGGAHKGFSAPSNARDVDEEESINYELGVRFDDRGTQADLGLFLTDYDNLVGTCTASSGADCEVGDAFNGDAATVVGLEFSLSHTIEGFGQFRFPFQATFTAIDATFDSDIANTDFFGAVQEGDPLPYIPQTQGLLTAGIERGRWGSYMSINVIGDSCARATCDQFEQIEGSTIVDWSLDYRWSDSLRFTATVENLLDDFDIVGRTPYGARPNKARTSIFGMRYEF